jgi:hypothetical protein
MTTKMNDKCLHCNRPRIAHLDGKVAVKNREGRFVIRTIFGLCPVGTPLTTYQVATPKNIIQQKAAAHARAARVYVMGRNCASRVSEALADTRRRNEAARKLHQE